jgi:hypothetical protein
MVKKQLIPFAQVIESGFVVRSPDKPVFGTFTPAGKEEPAFPVESRKAILLVPAKLPLPGTIHEFCNGICHDITEQVVPVNKMVTGIDVPVMFDHHCLTAGGGENTDPVWFPVPVCKRCIKMLDIDLCNIVSHPLIKDIVQEPAILSRPDGPCGNFPGFFIVCHNRDELDKPGSDLVTEEPVDLKGVIAVGTVHRAENIILHPVLLQQGEPLHHPVKRPFSGIVFTKGVMEFPWTIDTDTDEKIILT